MLPSDSSQRHCQHGTYNACAIAHQISILIDMQLVEIVFFSTSRQLHRGKKKGNLFMHLSIRDPDTELRHINRVVAALHDSICIILAVPYDKLIVVL